MDKGTGGAKDGLDRIQESLTLNFRKFEVVYKGQDDAGVETPAAKAAPKPAAKKPAVKKAAPKPAAKKAPVKKPAAEK